MKTKIALGLLFVLALAVILTGCSTKPDVNYDGFAQCMSEKGAVMYGTEWCSHCQNQKAAFGDSFELINFVDCDKQRDECLVAGIKGYPTWIINGELYPGEQSLTRLASLTGCEFVQDAKTE